jgi:tRNA pseudouridine55 synthase
MLKDQLKESFLQGEVLLFDKPLGWSSFDVVNKVKSLVKHVLGEKKLKIGHAGTLDPLASGLLILCTGKATKTIEYFQSQPKEYTGSFFIGSTTPSFDLETKPDEHYPTEHITPQMIFDAASSMQGEHHQLPPLFSAKKIEGTRAYDFARKGKHTELKTNLVNINSFEITKVEMPQVYFRIVCSKGTYIRAIARDLGNALHSGAYLSSLRRTRIGEKNVDDAWDLEIFEQKLREACS